MVDTINDHLKVFHSTLVDTEVVPRTLQRITGAGFTIKPEDTYTIAHLINRVEWYLLNRTNLDVLPEGLYTLLIERVLGYWMEDQMLKNAINADGMSGVVSAIALGDTRVDYDTSSTAEAQYRKIADYLKGFGGAEIYRYRRINW